MDDRITSNFLAPRYGYDNSRWGFAAGVMSQSLGDIREIVGSVAALRPSPVTVIIINHRSNDKKRRTSVGHSARTLRLSRGGKTADARGDIFSRGPPAS